MLYRNSKLFLCLPTIMTSPERANEKIILAYR
jgi:hypothetical protein